jgi:hypothetical protein
MVMGIAFLFCAHPAAQPTPLVGLRLRVDAVASGALTQSAFGPWFWLRRRTVPDLKQLSVVAVTGGDFMSLQGKLLQLRPVKIGSTAPARAGRYGGLVKRAPVVR